MTKIANMNSFKVMLLTILQIAFYLSDAAVPNDRSLLERNMLHSNELNLAKACISRQSFADYYKDRKQFIDDEIDQSFGMDTKLNEMEKLANNIIMNAKEAEYQTGFLHPYLFNPSRHIFEVLGAIKQSKLFQIIQRMPKGGILHAHDMALCSTDFVVSLTYWPHLWQRTTTDNNKIREFKFSHQQPSIEQWQSINNTTDDRDKMIWRLVSDVRAEIGSSKYDDYVRTLFTLFNKNVNPKIQFRDINDVWNRFLNIFKYIGPIVTYAPAWKEYYKHAMKEMLNDGVQYLEFRGILPPVCISFFFFYNNILCSLLYLKCETPSQMQLYDMDGNNYDEEAAMRIYVEALDEFKRGNPTFIGSKFIYAPMKAAKTETINGYFKIVRHLYEKFPEFLAGFDLVGQEDTSPSLLAFAENILELPSEISLFFHAGETNWFGSVDENLVSFIAKFQI